MNPSKIRPWYHKFKSTTSLTLPTSTDTYAINDMVTSSDGGENINFDFSNAVVGDGAYIGNTLVINRVTMLSDHLSTAVTNFNLWLFEDEVTNSTDNSPFTFASTDFDKDGIVIPLNNAYTGSTTNTQCRWQNTEQYQMTLKSTETKLYGLLESLGTYSHENAENLKFKIEGLIV